MSALSNGTPAGDLDTQDLIDRINALAVERTALYRKASDGLSLDERERLKAVNAELESLWLLRRQARAGSDDSDAIVVRHAA